MAFNQKLLIFGLCFLCFALRADTIVVAAAKWIDFSEPDGKGVYLELVKETFPDARLQFDVGSFARAKRLFREGKADLLVGIFENDIMNLGDVILPKYYLDIEHPIVAIYHPRITKLRHAEDFKNLTIGWFEEYAYDRYLPPHGKSYRFNDISTALELLENGRVDVVVDHIYNLDERQKRFFKTIELAPEMPIWIAFHNTQRGRQLKAIFELNMAIAFEQKTLRSIYGEYYEQARFDSLFQLNQ